MKKTDRLVCPLRRLLTRKNTRALDFSLFDSDGFHLVEKGNLKLDKSILKATDSSSNANPYKNDVCFNLNECDFPPLPSQYRSESLYSPVKYVGLVRKPICPLFKSFAQGYEPFRSTALPACSVPVSKSHSSLYQILVTSAPRVSPVRITTATFPSDIPNISYTNASFRYFFSELKTTSFFKSSFSSRQKYAPTLLLCLLNYQILHVLIFFLLQDFLFRHIRTVIELLQFLVPFYLPIFYRICVLAAIITMRLLMLILEVLWGNESLISIFHFLCKTIAPVYYSVSLPFLLSKKILSCILGLIKVLTLCTFRLIILFPRFFILLCSFTFVICVFDFQYELYW